MRQVLTVILKSLPTKQLSVPAMPCSVFAMIAAVPAMLCSLPAIIGTVPGMLHSVTASQWAVPVSMLSQPAAAAVQGEGWYERAVKSVEASFEPAAARPGQTVVLRLVIDLHEGFFTYPSTQPDPNAASMINRIEFPEPSTVIFVGVLKDPPNADIKAEPLLGIKAMRTHKGTVVFERTAVISPKAPAGEARVELNRFVLNVCDADNCYPPKTLKLGATLKVQGSPVAVEPAWAAEVERALAGK